MTASNYNAGATTTVLTFDTATGEQRTPVVVDGYLQDITVVGDRLVVRTGQRTTHVPRLLPCSTQIAVIDTVTGAQLGQPLRYGEPRRD